MNEKMLLQQHYLPHDVDNHSTLCHQRPLWDRQMKGGLVEWFRADGLRQLALTWLLGFRVFHFTISCSKIINVFVLNFD